MSESKDNIFEQIKVGKDNYRIRQAQFGGHYVEAHHDSQPEGEWTSMFYRSALDQDYWFASHELAREALLRLLASPYPTRVRWLHWLNHPPRTKMLDIIFGEDNKKEGLSYA